MERYAKGLTAGNHTLELGIKVMLAGVHYANSGNNADKPFNNNEPTNPKGDWETNSSFSQTK